MSKKDMLGEVVRLIAALPCAMLGVVRDLLERLGGADGETWLAATKRFLRKEDPWPKQSVVADVSVQLAKWVTLYRKYFGVELDPKTVRVPAHKEGFDRLIVVPCDLTVNKIYDACAKAFPCWRWTNDLNVAVVKNDRDLANGTYAVWVRDTVEADKETRNLSANDLAERKIAGVTLLERLLLELACFEETGNHLDLESVTLCSGSRYSDGVPGVCWCRDKLRVYWRCADDRGADLGVRVAVS
jgi:hypothetical protein